MRSQAIVVALTVALASLGGCNPASQTGQEQTVDAKPGIALSDAQMALPAVKGNPAAAYFTLANNGTAVATVKAVSIAGAGQAELHETRDGVMAPLDKLELAPGSTVKLAPGGIHVMVFDLDPKLIPGGKGEVTVTFADGDKASAPLALLAPGTQTADHSDHGADH